MLKVPLPVSFKVGGGDDPPGGDFAKKKEREKCVRRERLNSPKPGQGPSGGLGQRDGQGDFNRSHDVSFTFWMCFSKSACLLLDCNGEKTPLLICEGEGHPCIACRVHAFHLIAQIEHSSLSSQC